MMKEATKMKKEFTRRQLQVALPSAEASSGSSVERRTLSKRRTAAELYSSSSGEEECPSQPRGQRQGKRQALISYVLTAVKEELKHEICAAVGESVRKVIKEELWDLIAKAQPSLSVERLPSRCISKGDNRDLRLYVGTRLKLPAYTGQYMKGEKGDPILISLIDGKTGNIVAPEHSIKLDIVVLEGDFGKDESNDWTREEFEVHRVREREGKAPLLVGDLHVMLEGGIGEIGKLKFTDNSSWTRSQTFRIGLKVASGYCEGVRVLEAITEAFRVKENRTKLFKPYPAKPDGEVWRLKHVAKDGPYHDRLTKEGINIIEDLVREHIRDPARLRKMLGPGMTDSKWEELIGHAMSSAESGKLYLYSYDGTMMHGVIFDISGQLKGLVTDCFYVPADSMPVNQKDHYNSLVRNAYGNWDRVKEFSGATYAIPSSVPDVCPVEDFNHQDYLGLSGCHSTSFHNAALTEILDGVKGYDDTTVAGPLSNQQKTNLDVVIHDTPVQVLDQDIPGSQNLAPSQACSAPQTIPCGSTSIDEEGEIFSAKSPMRFSKTNHTEAELDSWINNLLESPPPDLHIRCRSRAAVVSWLRIKAVLQWGFFRRKLTNKVRPTIEQLE